MIRIILMQNEPESENDADSAPTVLAPNFMLNTSNRNITNVFIITSTFDQDNPTMLSRRCHVIMAMLSLCFQVIMIIVSSYRDIGTMTT
jgi:hypothetical protein